MWVTENRLDQWVRGNARDAQALIVELVWRLVAASSPKPRERRFPVGDSIGQHGPDGFLNVDLGFEPFVPEGASYWEIGTGTDAGKKATADYKDLVSSVPASVRKDATFVFVTPLSGVKDWQHTWKKQAQARWVNTRRKRRDWRDVQVIDGTKLIDWVCQFPNVELWLAKQTLSLAVPQVETPEQRWEVTRSIGEPPPLVAQLFLANRDDAIKKLAEIFEDTTKHLKLDTRYPDQVVDFVCAYLASLDEDRRVDAAGRCVIVSGIDAWNTLVAQQERHVLVADTGLDLTGDLGTALIQKARRAGHAVVFGGAPGGIPDPTSAPLPPPRVEHIREALEKAGYSDQRARTLSQKSGGNLGSLLRCLQNLSVVPAWAERSDASELAIAALLGAWSEAADADRAVAEDLAGNSYGEWVGRMREAALRPGTPLVHQNGQWKFVARFEGWYVLGPRLFDQHLDRLQGAAVAALQEHDPQFDLPSDERFAAGMHGKVLMHSRRLRSGLAETLALLGGHPEALTSCSTAKAETTAVLVVRALLADAGWTRWASLNDVLPLLAEAAPEEFLRCLEGTLDETPEVFDALFAQEGRGVTGWNYLTGVLWALETLAWDQTMLGRVAMCLGGLAARDPGGQWANRPANSLRNILLPWLPQTCAPLTKRAAAARALLQDYPAVGWQLLLGLLPEMHSSSTYTSRPAWRETIPVDWSPGVTRREYWDQIVLYVGIAIEAAKRELSRLGELVDHWEHLPPAAQDELSAYLSSDAVACLPDSSRYDLWSRLAEIAAKHRRFADAQWAMESGRVQQLEALAKRLMPTAPSSRHRRLFGERDVDYYEEPGNYEEQQRRLERIRGEAVAEVAAGGGMQAVVTFATTVDSPWRVGIAFGGVADPVADTVVLPGLLESEQTGIAQFAGGFVLGRFRQGSWAWVDGLDRSGWSSTQTGQFLSFLPFLPEAWNRAQLLLGQNAGAYWTRVSVNPYQAEAETLGRAVEAFLEYGRPHAAIQCIHRMVHEGRHPDVSVTVRALLLALETSERAQGIDGYAVVEVIKALQNDPRVQPDDLFRIEWSYVPLLDEHHGAAPKFLGNRLSSEPDFFCELIRLVFRSKGSEAPSEEASDQSRAIATNAYRLLNEWRVPPGAREDGSYDGAALSDWMDAMKRSAAATGHLEIAMTMAGHVLTHVPADPDGLWIHRAVAEVLNARDAGDLRDGFRTQILNSRGVHWVDPTGKPEDELAAKYHKDADMVEEAGYHRLATAVRQVAQSYEREAETVRARDQLDG